MTLVAAVNSGFDVIALADCRLSSEDSPVVQDVCQKLVAPNPWTLIGFSGRLCIAGDLLHQTVLRLGGTLSTEWLRDDALVRHHFSYFVRQHTRTARCRVGGCEEARAQFLIAWIDHTRSMLRAGDQVADGARFPPVQLLVVDLPGPHILRRGVGVAAIGSGAEVTTELRQMLPFLLNAGRNLGRSSPLRSFGLSATVYRFLYERDERTVGGMHQLAVLSAQGIDWVPHFYWAPVAPGYGTYVAMRIDHGRWVQEHRPSGIKIAIRPPPTIDVRYLPADPKNVFDPRFRLSPNSPGVIPVGRSRPILCPYDPADVPDSVRESWGDAVLEPCTFGTRGTAHPGPRRWRW